jgi:hypothetical protein
MASGRSHDRATWLLALPFGLLCWPWLGLAGVGVRGLSFLLGGLLLSPDLDTRSNPTRRWGPLRLLWWPYRRGLAHRSLLSHSPLLGTAGRLAYLLGMLLLLRRPWPPWAARAGPAAGGGPRPVADAASPADQPCWPGIEASSWLHLIQDGDPMPRLPRLLRRRRR